MRHFGMAVGAVELADSARHPNPDQAHVSGLSELPLVALWGRTFAVGLSSIRKQDFAAPPAWYKPVEQSRSRPPICRYPVGEGAKRVTTGIWDIWVLTLWKPSERHAWIGSRQGQGIGQGVAVTGMDDTRARLGDGPVAQALAAQRGRLFLFVPVCLGIGIGVYFGLPVEPTQAQWVWLAGAMACLGAIAVALPVQVRPLAIACLLVGAGGARWLGGAPIALPRRCWTTAIMARSKAAS